MSALPQSSTCFVCGVDNPRGLRQQFHIEQGCVTTVFRPEPSLCGYPGVVHGGIIAALLDETMGWAAAVAKRHFFITADLSVRYRRVLPDGLSFRVVGRYLGDKVGLWLTSGEIVGEDGMVYVTGSGRYAPAPEEAHRRFLEQTGLDW